MTISDRQYTVSKKQKLILINWFELRMRLNNITQLEDFSGNSSLHMSLLWLIEQETFKNNIKVRHPLMSALLPFLPYSSYSESKTFVAQIADDWCAPQFVGCKIYSSSFIEGVYCQWHVLATFRGLTKQSLKFQSKDDFLILSRYWWNNSWCLKCPQVEEQESQNLSCWSSRIRALQ